MAGSITVEITLTYAGNDYSAMVKVTSVNSFKGSVDMTYNPTTASTVTPSGGAPPGGERITLGANQFLSRPVTFTADPGGTFYAHGAADNGTSGDDSKAY